MWWKPRMETAWLNTSSTEITRSLSEESGPFSLNYQFDIANVLVLRKDVKLGRRAGEQTQSLWLGPSGRHTFAALAVRL